MATKYHRGYVPSDPSPEQIAEACKEIRAQWSQRELEKRCGDAAKHPVEIVQFAMDRRVKVAKLSD